jgi:uncharacterized protein (DUF58 family)
MSAPQEAPELRWYASPALRTLALLALVGFVLAVFLARSSLIVFAAPALGALVAASRTGRPAKRLRFTATLSETRCFERDILVLRVVVQRPSRNADVDVKAVLPYGLLVLDEADIDETADRVTFEWEVRAHRWGTYRPTVQLTLGAYAGMLLATSQEELAELRVFPRPSDLGQLPIPADLPDRFGLHVSTRSGSGTEFAGIRTYASGDQYRQVNWKASARHRKLLVNQRLPDQAADVVAMIDAYADVGPAGTSSLDLAVHGASDLAQAALRNGDRAGVVVLGGLIRWLPAELGARQFYRIVEQVLDARDEDFDLEPNLDRIPRGALPTRAVVIVFTPLLDPRTVGVLRDLRARGRSVVVVDVLTGEPDIKAARGQTELALRMWRIERRGTWILLADLGIPVVRWDPTLTLDSVLAPVARRRLARRSGAFSGVGS